jgi:hypothetical protein
VRNSRTAVPDLSRWATLALAVFAFLWVLYSPINATGSDPRGSLVASLALIETGSLDLRDYVDAADLPSRNLFEHSGRVDYYFPIGAPLAGVPAVWMARRLGLDVRLPEDEARVQKWLAAFSVALAILLVEALFELVFAGRNSASKDREIGLAAEQASAEAPRQHWIEGPTLAAAIVFGSGMTSNLGLALWSNNLATLFNLIALLLLLRWNGQRRRGLGDGFDDGDGPAAAKPGIELGLRRAGLLGLVLAASAVSRPSSALLGILVLFYLIPMHGWRSALRTAAVISCLALLFFAFSMLDYGQLLPPYYRPSRLSGSSTFLTAFAGNLLSPGRGILIFSPWLIIVLFGLLRARVRLIRQPMFMLAFAWSCLHLVAISRFPHWWDGHSFGNRLYVEAMPGLALITIFVWRDWSELPRNFGPESGRLRRLPSFLRASFLVLAAFAIWVHAWQALYNINTVRWNGGEWGPVLGDINIDRHPEYLWDWRHPQMLASERALAERFREFQERSIPVLELGQLLLPDADPRFFENWYEVEGEAGSRWRWSEGRWEGPDDRDIPRIVFRLAEPIDARRTVTLWLEAGSFEAQPAEIWLNGQSLGSFAPPSHFDPLRQGFPLPPGLLTGKNRLEIRLAEARVAGGGDDRVLGLAFRSLVLEVASR